MGQKLLEVLKRLWKGDSSVSVREQSELLNAKANELKNQGATEKAIEVYQKAIDADGSWSVPWYNLGLLHKQERNWAESLRCNHEAASLNPEDQAAWWNLGIAATALGNWDEARRAWRSFGLSIPEGTGEIRMDLGLVPIRLNPQSNAEVVWARRIDPARAILENIPLPTSGHRVGDVVLHDGAPRGSRKLGDRDVPVFDELELLVSSKLGTYEVIAEVSDAPSIEVLDQLCEAAGLKMEDWSRNLRNLCRLCSVGSPHEHHDPETAVDSVLKRLAIASAEREPVEDVLRQWLATCLDCQINSLQRVLGA